MSDTTKFLVLLAVLSSPVLAAGDPGVVGMPPDELLEAHATENPVAAPRRFVFRVHPLATMGGLAMSAGDLGPLLVVPMELELGEKHFSVYARAAPMFLFWRDSGLVAAAGVALNGGIRFYLSGAAPDGFWLGGHAGALVLGTEYAQAVVLDLEAQLGYQWVFENGFTIGLGAGISAPSGVNGQFPLSVSVPIGLAW